MYCYVVSLNIGRVWFVREMYIKRKRCAVGEKLGFGIRLFTDC
jgi:hypothetical protein